MEPENQSLTSSPGDTDAFDPHTIPREAGPGQLHSLQVTVQNENVGPLLKNDYHTGL